MRVHPRSAGDAGGDGAPRTDLPGPELARVVRYFEGSGVPPALLLSPISPSAWKMNSRKFGRTLLGLSPTEEVTQDRSGDAGID